MDIYEIRTLLAALEIHDSVNIVTDRNTITDILSDSYHNYKVMKIENDLYCVVRLSDRKEKKCEKLENNIKKLTAFNSVKVDGDVAYIRSLVSKYNKANNDNIKVRKTSNKAQLYRNSISFNGPLTMHQMNAIKSELHELLFPLFDGVQLGELIEKPMREKTVEEII